jgi:hypothetical protein
LAITFSVNIAGFEIKRWRISAAADAEAKLPPG